MSGLRAVGFRVQCFEGLQEFSFRAQGFEGVRGFSVGKVKEV